MIYFNRIMHRMLFPKADRTDHIHITQSLPCSWTWVNQAAQQTWSLVVHSECPGSLYYSVWYNPRKLQPESTQKTLING